MGCRCFGTDTPTLSPKLTATVLAAASLELKAEKQDAHSYWVMSVAFSPDGKTIVSGSYDETLKVWRMSPQSKGVRNEACVDLLKPKRKWPTTSAEVAKQYFRYKETLDREKEPLKKKPRGPPPKDHNGRSMRWDGTKEAGRWVRNV